MFSNKTKIPGNKVSVFIPFVTGNLFVGAFDIIDDANLVCPFRAHLISKGFAQMEVCAETIVKAKREKRREPQEEKIRRKQQYKRNQVKMKAVGKKNKRLSFDDRHSTLAYIDQNKKNHFS